MRPQHAPPRRARALLLALVVVAAAPASGCGWLWDWLDPPAPEDPFAAVRTVCPKFAQIQYEYGSTLAGPYSRLAFSDMRFDTTTDGGYTVTGSPRGDSDRCGYDIARRLGDICSGISCAQYRGGTPTLEGCLLEIEGAFYLPTPACALCGDGLCEPGVETSASCPQDCQCGDGQCQPSQGENILTCGQDCPNACGDRICARPFEGCECDPADTTCATCAIDCCLSVCGDSQCTQGETPDTCEQDCGTGTCGDGTCRGIESAFNCPLDCADRPLTCLNAPLQVFSTGTCGDDICEACEVWTCARDCRDAPFGVCPDPANPVGCPPEFCGDGACAGVEDAVNCPLDCPWPGNTCGNGRCDREDYYARCPEECPTLPFCGDGLCAPGEPKVAFVNGIPEGDAPESCAQDCGFTCAGVSGSDRAPACSVGAVAYCARGPQYTSSESLLTSNAHAVVRCDVGCDVVERCHGACAQRDDQPTCVDCAITRANKGHLLCGDAAAPACISASILSRCVADALSPSAACRHRQQVQCGGGCIDGACAPCGASAVCAPGSYCDASSGVCEPLCGDGLCVAHEDAWSCHQDCGRCGDGVCGGDEDAARCPLDCHCDGVCDPLDSAVTCPADFALCACGDGVCNAWEQGALEGVNEALGEGSCPADCVAATCGDGVCEGLEVMRAGPAWCLSDCPRCDDSGACAAATCGDGRCDYPEHTASCPQDCFCGDLVCDADEYKLSCPIDCDTCDNGVCEPPREDNNTCRRDCTCGDGVCLPGENNQICPQDCRCGDGVCDPNETTPGGRAPCPEDCY
jgi:hypothetical protein